MLAATALLAVGLNDPGAADLSAGQSGSESQTQTQSQTQSGSESGFGSEIGADPNAEPFGFAEGPDSGAVATTHHTSTSPAGDSSGPVGAETLRPDPPGARRPAPPIPAVADEGPVLAISPSHVAGPEGAAFGDVNMWPELAASVDIVKYHGIQIPDVPRVCAHTCATGVVTPLEPATLAAVSETEGLDLAVEFGEFPAGGVMPPGFPSVVEMASAQIAPVEEAGGRVTHIHLDGPLRRLMGLEPAAPGGLDGASAIARLADIVGDLDAAHPGIEVGLIVNLPNWDLTATHAGVRGTWTDRSGWTYLDLLEGLTDSLKSRGLALGFLEVDLPNNFLTATTTEAGDAAIDHLGQLVVLRTWADSAGADLHLILNTEPGPSGADFAPGTVASARFVAASGLEIDRLTVQSWYPTPERFGPEWEEGTFAHAARLAFAEVVRSEGGRESEGDVG